MDPQTLGKKTLELRQPRGLSRRELAFRANMTEPSIENLERGLVWPRRQKRRRLAEALAADPVELGQQELNSRRSS